MTSLHPFAAPEHEPYFLPGGPQYAGCAALLIHGFPGTPEELRRVGGFLHAGGLSVEGMLLPGFGPQLLDVARYTHRDWLAAVLHTLDALHNHFARVLLVGNSMGASLAVQAAGQRPVAGVLLFAPFWHVQPRALDALFGFAQPLLPMLPTLRPLRHVNFSRSGVRSELLRYLPGADLDHPQVQEELRNLSVDLRVLAEVRQAGLLAGAAAPHVAAPTLIVQGARDVLVRPTVTAALARRLPNLAGLLLVNGDHEFAHMDDPSAHAIAPLLANFAHQVLSSARQVESR